MQKPFISRINRLKRIKFAKEHLNKPLEFLEKSSEGGGIMMWGCMENSGLGELEFIDFTMDKHRYLNILKRNLKRCAEDLNLAVDNYFQQDNDPKHTARTVKLWLLYNTPKLLHTPPQHSDLNLIEHIWYLLEHRIRQHNITSKNTLKNVIKEEWTKISAEETFKLVHSMPKRLREILKRKGYPASY